MKLPFSTTIEGRKHHHPTWSTKETERCSMTSLTGVTKKWIPTNLLPREGKAWIKKTKLRLAKWKGVRNGWIKIWGLGLPRWRSGWESACRCRGYGFEPRSGKIPRAAEWLGPWATATEPALRNRRGHDGERPACRRRKPKIRYGA